jgi:hypothetical protein
MALRRATRTTELGIQSERQLTVAPAVVRGAGVTDNVEDDEVSDAAMADRVLQDALAAIGSWSDLDWDETVAALDRIRHESIPTPPLDDL